MGFFAVLLLAGGCATVEVRTAHSTGTDFSRLQTFNFKEPVQESPYFTKVNQDRVREAIVDELGKHGLRLSGHPDLLVGFYSTVAQKTFATGDSNAPKRSVAQTMKKHYGFVFGEGKDLNQQGEIEYKEGTLVVDLVEAKTERLVWQGTARGVLYENQPDENVERRIREAVRRILKNYPD
jgi:Domain of unknown function (DUF4136)